MLPGGFTPPLHRDNRLTRKLAEVSRHQPRHAGTKVSHRQWWVQHRWTGVGNAGVGITEGGITEVGIIVLGITRIGITGVLK